MACCSLTKRSMMTLGIMSLSVLILGILLVGLKDKILTAIISKAMIIEPGTSMYPNWVDLPLPLVTSIYFFNVTNAEEVKNGAKPILKEIGPYVFHEFHHKKVLAWNDANNTVTYKQIRTYKFLPNMTNGSLNDKITTLNVPAVTAGAMAMAQGKFVRGLINLALMAINEKLFVTKTVDELLFKGYKDPILTDTQNLPPSIVPQKMDRFGYFYPRNGSDWFDGVWNMFTGKNDLSKLGQIYSWNYSTSHTEFFPRPCGDVRGGGDFFPPGRQEDYVELYSNDLCRPLRMDFDSVQQMNGIRGNMYKLTPKFFANATDNPDNECYFSNAPSGVYNASSCRFGAPIFMSQPHFFQADPFYLNEVQSGLNPVEKKHETAFFVEPQSGLSVSVKARFQVNLLVEPIPEIKMFSKLRRTFFPAVSFNTIFDKILFSKMTIFQVWFESNIDLPKETINQVWYLSNVTNIVAISGYLLIGSGITFSILIGLFFWAKAKGAHSDSESSNVILNRSLFDESVEEQDDEAST